MSETADQDRDAATPAIAQIRDGEAGAAPPFGFVGLAERGMAVALRLAARFPLLGCDSDPALLSHLMDRVGAGAPVHTTPILAEVAERCDVIAVLRPNAEQAGVTKAELAAVARSGTLLLDLGISDPAATRRLAAELSDRSVHLLDAVVLGSEQDAAHGGLTVFAGGAEAVLAQALPYLETIGRVIRTGPIGTGQTLAVLLGAVAHAGQDARSEISALAKAAGLDPARLDDPELAKVAAADPDNLAIAVAVGGELQIDIPILRAASLAWRPENDRISEP